MLTFDKLKYKGASDRDVFYTSGIVSSILGLILSLVLVVFIHITRNEDVNYVAKVRRILNSYSSFIQRIDGEFCSDGYQVVIIKTFNEMLGIRDTIQSPILMSENNDETMTRFLIPTNTKILYTYEIKVENFDAIYGIAEESNDDKYSVEKVTVLDDDAE